MAKAVHATRRRATTLLADAVVLGAVAGALEPLRGQALGHTAAEVRALLVERDQTVLHAGELGRGVDGFGLLDGTHRIPGHPHAAFGHVQEAVGPVDAGLDIGDDTDVDLGAETAAATTAVEEGDDCGAEARDREAHEADDAAVEELPTGDADGLLVRRDPRHRGPGADQLEVAGIATGERRGPFDLASGDHCGGGLVSTSSTKRPRHDCGHAGAVSRDRLPWARSASERRVEANTTMPASTTMTGMTIASSSIGCS